MDCSLKSHKLNKQPNKRRKKGIKVVYISTPMKVKTSASEFRALVQQLTGRHSDTSGFMMADDGSNGEDGSNSGADLDLLHSSSEGSFADDQDSLVFQQQQSSEAQMFPFSSLFVNNDRSSFNYYDQLDELTSFDAAL